ncbi:MAG: TCR/Tet family MFS transporter [Xanthomonadales bacterium]|nr:TCR/Tet family MFS transporter [Xanthomonadales bacterium]
MNQGASPPTSTQRRRAATVFIFVTLLIDVLSFGLIIPVLPHLIEEFLGGDVPRAAIWYGWFQVAFLGMQFIFMPIQGALSDRFGRRPVILISTIGLGLDYVVMAIASTLPILLVARMVAGMTSASLSAANAYIADVTPQARRAQAYGIVGIAFGLGLSIAPVVGGALGSVDMRLPFWVAAALCAANFCYGLLVLPESLPPENRSRTFVFAHANLLGSLRLLRRYPRVLGMIGVAALDALAHMAAPATFVLYAGYRFGWGPLMVGVTLTLSGVLQSIVQGFLVKPIVGAMGENRALIFSLGCGTLGLTLFALAPTGYWFWAVMPITALWGAARPALQSLLSGAVDAREQGRLQGTVTSISSLAGIVGAIVFPIVLAIVTASERHDVWAGATFFIAAAAAGVGLLLAYRVVRR